MLRRILALTVAFLIVLCSTIAGVAFFRHDTGESVGVAHPAPSGEQAESPNHEVTAHNAPEHPVDPAPTPMTVQDAAAEHPVGHETPPAEVSHAEPAPKAAAEHPAAHGEPRLEHAADEVPSASTIRSGPAHDVARAALSNISPAEGLRQLEAALALPHTPEQAALLHEARGELYGQLAPPDFAQAQAAFELALEKTSDESLEEEIRYKAVQMLMLSGNNEEAEKVARAQLDLHPPQADAGFKLQLLQGQLQERAGQAELAEKNYRSVLDAAAAKSSDLGLESSLSLARTAALRLTQFYRSQNRGPEAEAVVADLKKYIGRMRGIPEETPEEG